MKTYEEILERYNELQNEIDWQTEKMKKWSIDCKSDKYMNFNLICREFFTLQWVLGLE